MRHTRLISAAVGALFVTAAVTGCSSEDVKSAAKSKADQVKASAAAKAGDLAKDKAGDLADGKLGDLAKQKAGELVKKLSPEDQQKLESALKSAGITIDTGDGAKSDGATGDDAAADPTATMAADFFAARQAALKDGDVSLLKQLTGPKKFTQVSRWVKKHAGQADKPFKVTVVGSQGNKADVCVGTKGKTARTVVLNKNGKVMAVRPGTHTC
ncbi:hypothetical protein AB3X52_00960 [Nocardioides sp. DS6]|uniref:Lipoprotein n=1 Tax=Nocardioides eburneus TaxID=3231482 RepID=A0ABV3SUN0_9ACTN